MVILYALPLLMINDGDNLPINKIQVIGSHHSYKKAIDPALFSVFNKKDSVSASKIDYEHIPVTTQLEKGYIICTRADSDIQKARRDDRSNFDAACALGAQIITTDYYEKSTHFKSGYVISFEAGKYFWLNPFFKN